MKKWIPIIILLLVVLVSCKENTPAFPAKIEDQTKAFLKDARSDSSSEYYISGEFDGYKIYVASTYTPYDSNMNALYISETSSLLDNIHLLRHNTDRTVRIALYFDQANIFKRPIPYIMPHANLAVCESVQMDLSNMKKLGTIPQGSINDDFSFFGHTNANLKVQVNSMVDNIMEGTFEGVVATRTGSKIVVKNGKFRMKIVVVKMATTPAT